MQVVANCFCDMLNINLISINPSSIIKSDPENSITNLPSVIKPDPLAALAPKRTLGALLSTLPESPRSSTRIPRLGLKSIGGGGGGVVISIYRLRIKIPTTKRKPLYSETLHAANLTARPELTGP